MTRKPRNMEWKHKDRKPHSPEESTTGQSGDSKLHTVVRPVRGNEGEGPASQFIGPRAEGPKKDKTR